MILTDPEWQAVLLSLKVSSLAVVISFPFGIFFAWVLVRCTFPGKSLLDSLLHLPLVLPPVVVGYLLLVVIGVLGGFFVVPLNALLQMRGKETVGAGNAIAVQNLGENMAMLLMLGLYSLAIRLGAPPVATGVGFGALFALAIALLWGWHQLQKRRV